MAITLKHKKIVIIEPKAHLAGHYSFELKNYCNFLSDSFQEIILLTPFGFKENISLPNNCSILNLLGNIKIIKSINNEPDFNYQYKFYRGVKEYLKANDIDIIHLWDIISTLPIFIYLYKFRKIIILTLKEVERERSSNLLKRNTQRYFSNMILRNISCKVIIHTKRLAFEAHSIGINEGKIKIIGLGVVNDIFSKNKEEARRKLKIPQSKIILLFFGVIRKDKGLNNLINLSKNIIDENVQILLAGENWLSINIGEIIEKHNLLNKFIIHDYYIEEAYVQLFYQASDYVLILHEQSFKGLSGVLLQAIQFEVPVVALGPSETSEFVISNSIGYEINNYNYAEIVKVMENPVEHSSKLIENLKSTKQKFSWGNIIQEYIELYSQS